MEIEYLYMVWYDFDGSDPNGVPTETVTLNGVDFVSTINPKLIITEGNGWISIANDNAAAGNTVADITNINNLNAAQKSVAALARWSNVNSFQATFAANSWPNDKRFFIFSGPVLM